MPRYFYDPIDVFVRGTWMTVGPRCVCYWEYGNTGRLKTAALIAEEITGHRIINLSDAQSLIREHYRDRDWKQMADVQCLLYKIPHVIAQSGRFYFEVREIVKALPERTRCTFCNKKLFRRWQPRDWIPASKVDRKLCCSLECWKNQNKKELHRCKQEQRKWLQRKKEIRALRSGKETLRLIRKAMKSPEVLQSLKKESRPATTSPG